MKNFSPGLTEALNESSTTFAFCWKFTRPDGKIFGFTEHSADIEFGGVSYKARTGFTPSALDSDLSLSVDNMEIQGYFDDDSVTIRDLETGKFDEAEVEVFYVDWRNPENRVFRASGFLGSMKFDGQSFAVEYRSLAQKLTIGLGRVYSGSCDAILGDSKCRANLVRGTHIVAGKVVNPNRRNSFQISIDDPSNVTNSQAGYFTDGFIEFTSGENIGLKYKIRDHAPNVLHLTIDTRFDISNGDAFTMTAGCNKTMDHCHNKFDNAINHQGFPHLPGDTVISTRLDIDPRDQADEHRFGDIQEIDPTQVPTRTTELIYGGGNADRVEYQRALSQTIDAIFDRAQAQIDSNDAIEQALAEVQRTRQIGEELLGLAENLISEGMRTGDMDTVMEGMTVMNEANSLIETANEAVESISTYRDAQSRIDSAALSAAQTENQAARDMFDADIATNEERAAAALNEIRESGFVGLNFEISRVADLTDGISDSLISTANEARSQGRLSDAARFSDLASDFMSVSVRSQEQESMIEQADDMVESTQQGVISADAMVDEAINEAVSASISASQTDETIDATQRGFWGDIADRITNDSAINPGRLAGAATSAAISVAAASAGVAAAPALAVAAVGGLGAYLGYYAGRVAYDNFRSKSAVTNPSGGRGGGGSDSSGSDRDRAGGGAQFGDGGYDPETGSFNPGLGIDPNDVGPR